MIKYILVVYALTADGPVSKPIVAFEDYRQCVALAQQLVPRLKIQLGTDQVSARCIRRTDV